MSNKKKDENIGMQYLEDLSNDDRYSLLVDPTNKYDLEEEHKRFIELYAQYNDLGYVCSLLELDIHIGKDYLLRYSTQHELRRLNLARYHRQIATRIVSYHDLGAYLSSWLVGDNIPEKDQLKRSEKLDLVKIMMQWHKGMKDFYEHPQHIIEATVEEELEQLKATDIRELIQRKKLLRDVTGAEQKLKGVEPEEVELVKEEDSPEKKLSKRELLDKILMSGEFSENETEFIKTLTVKELRELIK